MTGLIIFCVVAIVAAAWVLFQTARKTETEDAVDIPSQVTNEEQKPNQEAVASAWQIRPDTWYVCTNDCNYKYHFYKEGEMYLGADIDPHLEQAYKNFREATDEEIEEHISFIPTPEPTPEPAPEPEPEPEPEHDDRLDGVLKQFEDIVAVPRDGLTYAFMSTALNELITQWHEHRSLNGLPVLMRKELYQAIYDYYNENETLPTDLAYDTMTGFMVALMLGGLRPQDRTEIMKRGYEFGGYTKEADCYGYAWDEDPTNLRVFAASVLAAMLGKKRPNTEAMMVECGGIMYTKTLDELADGKRDCVGRDDFFIDFREFMPTAPGPYAPGYTDRPDVTYPHEEKEANGNLKTDLAIHRFVCETFNLGDTLFFQRTVQAIADKEGEMTHLFGETHTVDDPRYGMMRFAPVFGRLNIGKTIATDGHIARLCAATQAASNSARGILQTATLSPKQYGRLRPGCSWSQEARKHSATHDRLNVLANFYIEDGDGCPTGYYDGTGRWVHPEQCASPEQYEEMCKNNLYANSYPSGHASGIMGVALALIELMPDKADAILAAAFDFSQSRSITRYHWMSDILNGLVVGCCQYFVSRAASDFSDLLAAADKETQTL